jgi:hypothetical protein
MSTRISTTVLATAIAIPSTAPVIAGMPKAEKTTILNSVATRLWPTAPGMATFFTASRSPR